MVKVAESMLAFAILASLLSRMLGVVLVCIFKKEEDGKRK